MCHQFRYYKTSLIGYKQHNIATVLNTPDAIKLLFSHPQCRYIYTVMSLMSYKVLSSNFLNMYCYYNLEWLWCVCVYWARLIYSCEAFIPDNILRHRKHRVLVETMYLGHGYINMFNTRNKTYMFGVIAKW